MVISTVILGSFPAQAGNDLLGVGLDVLKSVSSSATPAEESVKTGSNISKNNGEVGKGLKEALRVGTGRAVDLIGRPDGFNGNPKLHIPLPSSLAMVQGALNRAGLGSLTNDLELRLNRAAESAVPHVKELFLKAINEMTLEDVVGIFKGPPDAATRYFAGKMSKPLAERMTPVVERSLADAGAVQSLNGVMDKYRSLPLLPSVDTDLTGYVVQKASDGLFHTIGQQEAAIRSDPGARSTELLKRVFGGRH
ncbi:MAG: DUF4197 domain-containing protein [Alphaproteobacteria bacterium]